MKSIRCLIVITRENCNEWNQLSGKIYVFNKSENYGNVQTNNRGMTTTKEDEKKIRKKIFTVISWHCFWTQQLIIYNNNNNNIIIIMLYVEGKNQRFVFYIYY